MATSRKQNAWERRLKEIEREKADVRAQLEAVRRWADAVPDAAQMLQEPRLRGTAVPEGYRADPAARRFGDADVVETESEQSPDGESSLNFAPGPDGLDDYRRIIPDLQRLMAPGGLAILEIGHTQRILVTELAEAVGFAVTCRQDLGGRDRALLLTRA